MPLDPAWIALIGSAGGAVLLKTTEHFLAKGTQNSTDAQKLREELRLQIEDQRADINKLEAEVNEWRDKYYNLRDEHVKLQAELIVRLKEIKENINNESNDQ